MFLGSLAEHLISTDPVATGSNYRETVVTDAELVDKSKPVGVTLATK